MKKLLQSRYELVLLGLVIVSSTIIYSFISFQKHNHFQTFAWDTTFFVQELYFIKQLKPPLTSLYEMNALGDHFQITFLLVGGFFYFIWSDPKVIFFVQALMVSLSAIPLFFLSKQILSSANVKPFYWRILSLSIVLAYLFSVSTQGMLTDEFHNDPIASLPLLTLLYALFAKKDKLYWVSLIFLFLTKETYGLLAIPLGVYIIIATRQFKKGVLTSLIGGMTFLILIYLVMPKFSPTGQYFHYADGNKPSDVIGEIIKNPTSAITEFIDTPEKVKTLFISFLSFGFLPLFSGIHLLLPFAALALRFYDDTTPLLYRFNNHYAAPLLPLMAVSTILGIKKLLEMLELTRPSLGGRTKKLELVFLLFSLYLLLFTFAQNILFHGAINSLLKPSFYQTQDWQRDTYELIGKVPKQASVSANNSLLAHLSERSELYLFPKYGEAEYIALDLSEGPNKFAPLQSSKEAEQKFQEILKEGKYKIIWQRNKSILLKRLIFTNPSKG